MPYVNIKVTREGTTPDRQGVTPEQKAELIKGVSELLLEGAEQAARRDLRRHQRGRAWKTGASAACRSRPGARRMRPSVSRITEVDDEQLA